MNPNLDRLEARLRTFFEDNLLKIFGGTVAPYQLADDLIKVMQDELLSIPDSTAAVPTRFLLHVPPQDWLDWQAKKPFVQDLADQLLTRGMQAGIPFETPLVIDLKVDPAIPAGQVAITLAPQPPSTPLHDTAAMEPLNNLEELSAVPENAFLVVGGKTNFPLEKPVINIGRHSDNDLVIPDEYTSRHHAQLRAINQQYVIFDVGSTGGLILNGKPITQATLQPGDVVKIGLVHLIYIQDSTGAHLTKAVDVSSGDIDNGE